MKRGDIYTAAIGGAFGGKPRPVLVVQADAYATESKRLVALIGSPMQDAPLVRVEVRPDLTNNLRSISHVMVDTILTPRRDEFGKHVGRLEEIDMRRVDAALLLVMGLGVPE